MEYTIKIIGSGTLKDILLSMYDIADAIENDIELENSGELEKENSTESDPWYEDPNVYVMLNPME